MESRRSGLSMVLGTALGSVGLALAGGLLGFHGVAGTTGDVRGPGFYLALALFGGTVVVGVIRGTRPLL